MLLVGARPLDAAELLQARGSSSPRASGTAYAVRSRRSSAVGRAPVVPRRRAISQMISISSRAPGGGSIALRTRCTRRSLLVTVPSDSHHVAAAGSTTSASSAVSVQEDVLHHQVFEARRAAAARGRCRPPSCTGFSPIDVEAVHLAALHRVEHLATDASPASAESATPQAASNFARAASVGLHVLEAGQPVGNGPHVAAALHVVLAAERIQSRCRSGRRGRSAGRG